MLLTDFLNMEFNMEFEHVSVLLEQSIELLDIKPNGIYVDCTLGSGGHSREILNKLTNGKLIGFDKDIDAIKHCQTVFKDNSNVIINHTDFKNVCKTLDQLGIDKVDGVLMDLGMSSWQIDNFERGFSYMTNGPLDMRMDSHQTLTAFEVVNEYSEEKLAKIIEDYGEEPFARQIARNIAIQREIGAINNTLDLVDIIDHSLPYSYKRKIGHSSKKTFQAIRIEVNQELEHLKETIAKLIKRLNKQGRIAIISFHSLEDRIVKETFREYATGCVCPKSFPICICGHKADLKLITRKPIIPSEQEMQINSRANSAKLRVAEKII